MINIPIELFYGTKVIVKWEHEVGDPKRKHKKKRIAKKWLKRYGVWEESDGACRKGYAVYVELNKTLYVSRHTYVEMARYVKESSRRLGKKIPHHGNNCTRY